MARSALLVDANLFILYVVGTTDRALISQHKRLKAYTVEDFDLLLSLFDEASTVMVTPNTLTETSNLIRQISEPARGRLVAMFRKIVAIAVETYVPSVAAVERPEYLVLGLTDAGLVACLTNEISLLTADFDLYGAALKARKPALNFNHFRQI